GKPEGTGLGLAIVQKVAADHGGTVDVHSRPGETVFTLTLPQERTHETLPPGRPAPSTGRQGAEVLPS
ncbi:MAG TPA: ATP-binding protein, partial [Polyangiales bacterium]|nr:ATP-binding protein [Polyangiales bacterium]